MLRQSYVIAAGGANTTIAQHICLYCPKNKDIVNRRKKVKELRSKASFDDWHPKFVKELSLSMKKDEVYHTGVKDVILVEYITNALENRTDQDDYGTIKTRYECGAF